MPASENAPNIALLDARECGRIREKRGKALDDAEQGSDAPTGPRSAHPAARATHCALGGRRFWAFSVARWQNLQMLLTRPLAVGPMPGMWIAHDGGSACAKDGRLLAR